MPTRMRHPAADTPTTLAAPGTEGAIVLAPAPEDAEALLRLIQWVRTRLGWEQLLRFTLWGACVGLVLLIAAQSVAWLLWLEVPVLVTIAAVVVPPLAGVAIAWLRWPSVSRAARTADQRLGLDERLGTATELLEPARAGVPTRLAALQVRDARQVAGTALGRWPSPLRRLRRESYAVLALGALGVGALLLPGLADSPGWTRRPVAGADAPGLASASEDTLAGGPLAPALPQSGLPEAGNGDPQSVPGQEGQTAEEGATTSQDAETAAAQREALNRLADALRETSVGRDAADSIAQGDYREAARQLAELGREADQLSEDAKEQLADALRDASADPSSERSGLAEAEQEAASALSGSDYEDQREALEQLGQQVTETGDDLTNGAMAASESQQVPGTSQFGPGQFDQAQPATEGGPGQNESQGNRSQDSQQAQPGQQGTSNRAGTGSGTSDGAPDRMTGPGEDASAGQEPGPPGEGGERPSIPSDQQAPRLDSAGEQVEVPAELGRGQGSSPAEGLPDPSAREDSASTSMASEQGSAQEPGLVAPEQNLVPTDRRQVVRDYFNGEQ